MAAKRDSCPVLQRIAAIRLDDADTPLFKTLLKCGEALNIPITNVKLGASNMSYPVLLPKDVLESVAKQTGCVHRLLGVQPSRAPETFLQFWKTYRLAYPNHEIFQMGFSDSDFSNIAPYFLHGDGGRTFKKDSILICSMFPAMGAGTSKCYVPDMAKPQSRKRSREAAMADPSEVVMGINLLGNSLGNRFLFVAMHNKFIKEDRTIFYDLLHLWAKEMGKLLTEGFNCGGHTYKLAVLGLVGDAPFLRDAGLMNRSFNNIRKSETSTANLPGVCHLCSAGKTNGPHYEDLNILSADWTSTTGFRNWLPWDEPSPLLAYLPIEQQDQANFFKGDLFHIWYAGVGKDFCGSSLIYMLRTVMNKGSKSESMQFLNQELRRFQQSERTEAVHFGKFSWDLLDYDGPRNFPQGKWSKGMDTGKVTKFIEFLVPNYLLEHDDGHQAMLALIKDACGFIGTFLRTILAAGIFLTEEQAYRSISAGYSFLMTYQKLAKLALSLKKALFKLKPKCHALAHLILEMLVQYRKNPKAVCNPTSFSTFMCEDFIGHIARLSRRVSPRIQGQKLAYRYLTALRKALKQETS